MTPPYSCSYLSFTERWLWIAWGNSTFTNGEIESQNGEVL